MNRMAMRTAAGPHWLASSASAIIGSKCSAEVTGWSMPA